MLAACLSPAIVSSWLDAFSQSRASAIALLIGLGLLALSLLILVFTRWGQAKPLSKCLALSVFAHILLMAYAYGIQLFTDDAPSRGEEVIKLTVVDTDEQPQPQTEKSKPWDNFTTESPVAPTLGAPRRLDAATPPPIERQTQAEDIPVKMPQLVEPSPWVEPNVLLPQAPPTAAVEAQRQPLIAAAPEIDATSVEPMEAPAPPQPLATEPERLAIAETAAVPLRRFVSQAITDRSEDDRDLQRLMDMPLPLRTPDAAFGHIDDPQRARNEIKSPQAAANPLRTTPAPAIENISDGASSPAPSAGSVTRWELVAVRRTGDGRELPLSLRGRMVEDRLSLATSNGGSVRTEQAVDSALQWLAANQHANGGWDCDMHAGGQETRVLGHDRKGAGSDADMAVTGLALLAFLGAGHTHMDGDYRETVQRGLEFLLRQQAADGNLAANARLFAKMYCHGMATLALGEAFAMTGDARYNRILRTLLDTPFAPSMRPAAGGVINPVTQAIPASSDGRSWLYAVPNWVGSRSPQKLVAECCVF